MKQEKWQWSEYNGLGLEKVPPRRAGSNILDKVVQYLNCKWIAIDDNCFNSVQLLSRPNLLQYCFGSKTAWWSVISEICNHYERTFFSTSHLIRNQQWRIQRVSGSALSPTPWDPIHLFPHTFSPKSARIRHRCAPNEVGTHPQREILDPPLINITKGSLSIHKNW